MTVTFNETQTQGFASTLVNAYTAQEPIGRKHTLVLRADAAGLLHWLDYLQDGANENVSDQMERLGCLPSTGFMVIHALWALHTRVWVDGIGFDPTLVRPPHLPLRKPLPQMFHNWLGPDGHRKLLHLWPVKLLQAGRSDYDYVGVMAMREAASFRR